MKKRQKAAIASTIFYAALNFNGCVYGPPPTDYDDPDLARKLPVSVEDQLLEETPDEQPEETA